MNILGLLIIFIVKIFQDACAPYDLISLMLLDELASNVYDVLYDGYSAI